MGHPVMSGRGRSPDEIFCDVLTYFDSYLLPLMHHQTVSYWAPRGVCTSAPVAVGVHIGNGYGHVSFKIICFIISLFLIRVAIQGTVTRTSYE